MTITEEQVKDAIAYAEAEVKRRALNGKKRQELTLEAIAALFAEAAAADEMALAGLPADLRMSRYVSLRDAMRAHVSGDPAKLKRVFARAPTLPKLYGTAEAAAALDLPKSHMYRLRDSGRLPTPMEELANGPVFLAEEIDVLAEELRAERAGRAARKEARRVAAMG